MPKSSNIIRLPKDLQEFAEECVRMGQYESVENVVFEALKEKRHTILLKELDAADAELEVNLDIKCTPKELMRSIYTELGLNQQPISSKVSLIYSLLAKQDIKRVLKDTKNNSRQIKPYGKLIEEALSVIAKNPKQGQPYSYERPGIFIYPVLQPNKTPRYVLFYRTSRTGIVKALRILHECYLDEEISLKLFAS